MGLRKRFKGLRVAPGRHCKKMSPSAIGWCPGLPRSVIFEVRCDAAGELYHLVAGWKATKEEEQGSVKNI